MDLTTTFSFIDTIPTASTIFPLILLLFLIFLIKYKIQVVSLLALIIVPLIFFYGAYQVIFVNNDGDYWNSVLIASLLIGMGLLIYGSALIGLWREKNPPHCLLCNKKGNDVLVKNGTDRREKYCREHIMEKFTNGFLSFSNKMVVFHPEQERKYCSTMYPYYPLEEMVSMYYFPKEAAENVRNILEKINGRCRKCQENQAVVAYYSKGVLTWSSTGPWVEKVKAVPQLLCKKCTLKLISSGLWENKSDFSDNGLFVPYKGEGVYVNTFL